MQIDGFTVVLIGILARLLLGILFLVFWLRDKRALWFVWWSATFFLGYVAALFYLLNRFAVLSAPFGYEVAILIAAIACCWQGVRAFEGREPLWLPVLVAPTIWMLACLIPGFLETASYRVVLSSLLLSPLAATSAVESWRGREERLPSRWAIILLFASLSIFFGVRIALIGVAPFPFGRAAHAIELGGRVQSDPRPSNYHSRRAHCGHDPGAPRARAEAQGADRSAFCDDGDISRIRKGASNLRGIFLSCARH
jgi:hypothetical protein